MSWPTFFTLVNAMILGVAASVFATFSHGHPDLVCGMMSVTVALLFAGMSVTEKLNQLLKQGAERQVNQPSKG